MIKYSRIKSDTLAMFYSILFHFSKKAWAIHPQFLALQLIYGYVWSFTSQLNFDRYCAFIIIKVYNF